MKPPKKNKRVKKIERVTDFLDKLDWMFNLNNFTKHIELIKTQDEPLKVAEIISDMVYQEITIRLFPRFWECSLDVQRAALLHELVHTVLQDTKMVAMDLIDGKLHTESEIKNVNEKAVTTITNYIDYFLRNNGLGYAKRAYKDYIKK